MALEYLNKAARTASSGKEGVRAPGRNVDLSAAE